MAFLALMVAIGGSVGIAQPTLPLSTRQTCYCRYHVNGQPMQETCVHLPAATFRDGARPLFPTEERYCLPRDQFCATEPLGCPPAPAPIDHEAWNLTTVKCTDAATCAAPDALVTLTVTVDNVSYDLLAANASLYSAFQQAVSQAVAAEVGGGISAQHVTVTLSPGSVVITATILPPSKVGALRAFVSLNASSSLSGTLVSTIVNLDGIDSVISGDVKIGRLALADLVPAQTPSPPPSPPAPVQEALFLDRFADPARAIWPRERQEYLVRCTVPCSEATTGLLALSCGNATFGGPESGTFLSSDLWFTLTIDVRLLHTGMNYHLCVDIDGAGTAYSFADSGLLAFISPAVHLFPSATLNFTPTLSFRVTCDVGCGTMSTAFLALSCPTGDSDGRRAAVPVFGTESALLGRRQPLEVQTVWEEKDTITAAKEIAGDRFGASVSLFGDFLAVGAPGVNAGAGVVFVFEHIREGKPLNPWVQVQTLSPPANFNDPLGRFGWSVAMGLSFLAVGTPHDERDTETDATGTVFVFHLSYQFTWELEQQLKGHLEKGWWLGRPDRFGWACALTGSQTEPLLAVGAPEADDVVLDGGVVFIFERTVAAGKATWTLTQTLTSFEAGPYAFFGASLAVSSDGTLLVVGAPGADNGTATDAGQAFLFQRGWGGQWLEVAQLQPDVSSSGGRFGTSVALGLGSVWVGEPGVGAGAGSAHVFTDGTDMSLNSTDVASSGWTLQQTLTGSSASAEFGTAISAQEGLAATTAPGEDGGVGAVYVWVREGTYWSQQARLQPVAFKAGEGFGRQTASEVLGVAGAPLALHGGRVVCGAAYAGGGPVSGSGAAYPFELLDGGAVFDLTLRIEGLQRGKKYKLCMDFDGYKNKLAFGNTGLEFTIGETTTTTTTTTRTTSTTSTSSATTTSSSTTTATSTSTTATTSTTSTTSTTVSTTTSSTSTTNFTETTTTSTLTNTSTTTTSVTETITTTTYTTQTTTQTSVTSTTTSSDTSTSTTTTSTSTTTTGTTTSSSSTTASETTMTTSSTSTSSTSTATRTTTSSFLTNFSANDTDTTTTAGDLMDTTSSGSVWNTTASTTTLDANAGELPENATSTSSPFINDTDTTTTNSNAEQANVSTSSALPFINDTDTTTTTVDEANSNTSSVNSSGEQAVDDVNNLSNESNISMTNVSKEEAAPTSPEW